MAKGSGGTRVINKTERNVQDNRSEYAGALASGQYDTKNTYFSEDTGAYVLVDKERKYDADEMEVAKVFADNGYIVQLTPEGIEIYATNHITKKGKVISKYSDGVVGGLTYEQRTIESPGKDPAKKVSNAIEHAKLKASDIAVIYDKNGSLHRKDMEDGIDIYEGFSTNLYRAKLIININSKKEMNFWYHNK